MALSNAERQKRYRDRARDALRNTSPAQPAPSTPPLLSAAIALMREADEDVAGHALPDWKPDLAAVAEFVSQTFAALESYGGLSRPAEFALADAMGGGRDYVEAVFQWIAAQRKWNDLPTRQRKKEHRPEPPPLPDGVT